MTLVAIRSGISGRSILNDQFKKKKIYFVILKILSLIQDRHILIRRSQTRDYNFFYHNKFKSLLKTCLRCPNSLPLAPRSHGSF